MKAAVGRCLRFLNVSAIHPIRRDQREEGKDSIRALAAKNLERPETLELRGEPLALSLSCNVEQRLWEDLNVYYVLV